MEATWFGKTKCVHKLSVRGKAGLKAAVTIDMISALYWDNRKSALKQDPIHRRFHLMKIQTFLMEKA